MGEQLVGTFIMRFRLQRLKLSKQPVSVTGGGLTYRGLGEQCLPVPFPWHQLPSAPAREVLHSVVEYLGECSLHLRAHMICLCSFFFS